MGPPMAIRSPAKSISPTPEATISDPPRLKAKASEASVVPDTAIDWPAEIVLADSVRTPTLSVEPLPPVPYSHTDPFGAAKVDPLRIRIPGWNDPSMESKPKIVRLPPVAVTAVAATAPGTAETKLASVT